MLLHCEKLFKIPLLNERELVDQTWRPAAELTKKRYHGKKTMKKGSIRFSLLRDN